VSERQRGKLNIRRTAAAEPMSDCDRQTAEAILAKLVARAFAADHPELFGSRREGGDGSGEDPSRQSNSAE